MICVFWIFHIVIYTLANLIGSEGNVLPQYNQLLYRTSRLVTILFFCCITINWLILKPLDVSLIGTYTDWIITLIFFVFSDTFFLVFKGFRFKNSMSLLNNKSEPKHRFYKWYTVLRKAYIISILVRLALYLPLTYMHNMFNDRFEFFYPLMTIPKEDGAERRFKDLVIFNSIHLNEKQLSTKEGNLCVYVRHYFIFKKKILQTKYYIERRSLNDYYINKFGDDSIHIEDVNISIRKTDSGYNIYGKKYNKSFSLISVR